MLKMLGVYLIALGICVLRTEGQGLGERCFDDNGNDGTCKLFTECASVAGTKFPKICGIYNAEPLMCCVNSTGQQYTVAAAASRIKRTAIEHLDIRNKREDIASCPPVPSIDTSPRIGKKAWDKCAEYQERYIYPCQHSQDGHYVRGDFCSNGLTVNPENATEGEFRHMALLGYGTVDEKKFYCNGFIVSEYFILTAARCSYSINDITVAYALLGALDQSKQYPKDNLYNIKMIHKHPDYRIPSYYDNIALLETDRQIIMSSMIVPACLDTGNQAPAEALVTGWGRTARDGDISNYLQKVAVSNFDGECSRIYKPHRFLKKGYDSKTQLCYGGKSRDTCEGFLGAPLQIESPDFKCMYTVIGIPLFGKPCGSGEPGVYVRVAEYVPWIESVIWP